MIEYGRKTKPKKYPCGSQQNHKNPWTETKKFHAEFPSLKNFQKVLDIKTVNKVW